MDRPTCESCVYWDRVSEVAGYCRHDPPDSSTLRWPNTHRTSWCGQHDKFPAWLGGSWPARVDCEACGKKNLDQYATIGSWNSLCNECADKAIKAEANEA
jgi:hypothetical protein